MLADYFILFSENEEVYSIFFNGFWNDEAEKLLKEKLLEIKPDLIIISLLTSEFKSNKKLADLTRCLLSQDTTKIISGGPHAYLDPQACLMISDFVCVGEGELTLLELCKQFHLKKGWDNINLENVPNLYYHCGNKIKKSKIFSIQERRLMNCRFQPMEIRIFLYLMEKLLLEISNLYPL